jgi:hypothetical protein
MEHFYKSIQGFFNFQDLYTKVIKELPDTSNIVEVGAWKGCSTAFLAVEIINSGKNIKLDVVDTWSGGIPDPSSHLYEEDLKKNNDNIVEIFKKNIKPVEHIIKLIQMTSADASKLYDNKSLDFVFIDANHTYESVKEDILSWLPKIKNGGIIGGHDYDFHAIPGVTKAVKEIFNNNKIIVIKGSIDELRPNDFPVSSWMIYV